MDLIIERPDGRYESPHPDFEGVIWDSKREAIRALCARANEQMEEIERTLARAQERELESAARQRRGRQTVLPPEAA